MDVKGDCGEDDGSAARGIGYGGCYKDVCSGERRLWR